MVQAVVAHRYKYAPPPAEPLRTAGVVGLLFPSQYPVERDSVFDGVRLAGFKIRANALLMA